MDELAKVRPYMNLLKKLMNAFFNSKFSYPLTWMCHSRANDNKTKGLHERFLRIMYFESHRMKEKDAVGKGRALLSFITETIKLQTLKYVM